MWASLESVLSAQADASRWWLAISGGVDSIVLLDLLVRWREAQAGAGNLPPLAAIHINHGLHPDADDWASLVARHCRTRGVPLREQRVTVSAAGRGLEAAAREARYGVFTALIEPGAVLFMAHHLDDQMETMLLRLLRGAGVRGMAGIPPTRRLGAGSLCRPLLGVSRGEILAWAREHDLDHVSDPANDDLAHDRNYLRHRVVPALLERWPGARETIARSAELHRIAAEHLEAAALPAVQSTLGDTGVTIDGIDHPEQLAQGLRNWLLSLDQLPPSRDRLLEFCRQVLEAAPDRRPALRLGALVLCRWRGAVWRLPADSPVQFPDQVRAGVACRGDWGCLNWRPATTGIAAGTPLTLRAAHPGERIRTPGGRSKPLSDWLQACEVPPWWRPRLPILEAAGAAVAILGVGLLYLEAPADGSALEPVWTPPGSGLFIEPTGGILVD